MPEIVTF